MADPRLVIFDVDGTLVDSQGEIVAAMAFAFGSEALPVPDKTAILSVVGLSLPEAMLQLVPEAADAARARLVDGYKAAYMDRRKTFGAAAGSPMYPGAQAALDALHADPNTLLAVATGKSRRGLDKLIEAHGWGHLFISQQTSDHHPSKPHPGMVLAALADAGIAPDRAVMVGDTTFDMTMGRAAGVGTIGVSWGYHPAGTLGADRLIDRFEALPDAITALIGPKL